MTAVALHVPEIVRHIGRFAQVALDRSVARVVIFVTGGLLCLLLSVRPVAAQNWSFDARRIALGGVGDTENVAWSLVAEQRGYSTLVLPFGLFQVLDDLSVYNPTDARFDPVRATEYLASPLHYTFDRDGSTSGQQFVSDVVNALLSLDLNTYKGFTPAVAYDAEGLASPRFGKTFRVWSGRDGTFQGFYVGAGPYFALQTVNRFDEDLVNILDSEDDVYIPNANLFVTSRTTPQAALALTGGYRARIAGPSLSALGTDRNGIYLAVDYSYLVGFRYEDYDLAVRFDTDANGLVTVAPTTPPLGINRVTSSRGHGAAVDVGTVLVVDRWDFGFGVNGIGNRITWTGIMHEGIVLQSLVDGGDFLRIPLRPTGDDLRVELPVHYTTNIAYHADEWLAIGEYARGYQGNTVRAGLERRLGRMELRAGVRYSADRWHLSGGAGVRVAPGVSIDVGAFGTAANLERQRKLALAFSLRFSDPDRR
jgi:hypothetical protein